MRRGQRLDSVSLSSSYSHVPDTMRSITTLAALATLASAKTYTLHTTSQGDSFFDAWTFPGPWIHSRWRGIGIYTDPIAYARLQAAGIRLPIRLLMMRRIAATTVRARLHVAGIGSAPKLDPLGLSNKTFAESDGIVSINDKKHAVLRVSRDEVVYNEKRYSFRIESSELFGVGSLFVLDAVHIPYGCSVYAASLHSLVLPSN